MRGFKLDKKEITLIFKEFARKNLLSQEEKYGRKQKYKGQYCCSEEEVESFVKIFDKLLDEKAQMDYDFFLNLFKKEEDI